MCGVMSMADFQNGIVRANGTPLPPDQNAAVLQKLTKTFEPLAGQKVCEALRVRDGQLEKIGQVERVDLPLPGKPVRWIGQSEGYRVSTR